MVFREQSALEKRRIILSLLLLDITVCHGNLGVMEKLLDGDLFTCP